MLCRPRQRRSGRGQRVCCKRLSTVQDGLLATRLVRRSDRSVSEATPELTHPPLTGDRVGQYLLGEVLGVGGMATVYAATTPDGDGFAVKVLHPGRNDDEEARRFRREFLTLRALRHPAVVAVYESGRAGAYPWIAMERIQGTDLETLIERWARNPPPGRFDLVEQIFRDICSSLAYVHSQGLIHRDLKPSNVLVTAHHHAKLTDFGVVKAPLGQFHTQLTTVGSLVGTAAYMSPEQISGDPVDGRSDLYSLGAVLYVMLTGRRPIVADTVAGYLARHLNEAPVDPREHDPRVPPPFARLCLRLLSKDPAQRYATAEQVLASLDAHEDSIHFDAHGHDAEMAEMVHLLSRLRPGSGGLVVVSGPEGSGRTTLLKKFMDIGRADGRGFSWGTAKDSDLLEVLCNQIPSLGPKGAGGTPVNRISVRTHGRPWVLIVDDLEQIQSDALQALTELLRQQVAIEGEPLQLVVALPPAPRPEAVGRFCSGATTGVNPHVVELSGLSVAGARSLLRDLGLRGAACGALAWRMVEDGRVWPGQMVHQLRALERDGWLQRSAHGGLELQKSVEALRQAPLPVPARQRQRHADALARLDTIERALLDTLVVLGGGSDPATVAEITQLESHTVERTVLRMARRGMVEETQTGGQVVLQLGDGWPQSLLYELIEPTPRAELHRRIARTLQRQRGRPSITEVASHLLRGHQPALALPMLVRGATIAHRSDRHSDARTLLNDAHAALAQATANGPGPELTSLETQLASLDAELKERAGDRHGALLAWERSLRSAQAEGKADAIHRALAGAAMIRASEYQTREAADELAAIWRKVSVGDPSWNQVTRVLAESLLTTHRHALAFQLWKRLHMMGKEIGSPALAAQARFGRALHLLAEPDLEPARQALARAELALRDTRDVEQLARCLLLEASLAYASGRLFPARELALEVQRLLRPGAALSVQAGALAIHTLDATGRTAKAHDDAEALIIQAQELRFDARNELLARIDAARALLTIGAMDKCSRLLDLGDRDPADLKFAAGFDDPVGQLRALRARVLPDPDLSTAEAWDALSQELPLLPTISARIALDAVHALTRAGDLSAPDALEEALDRTERPGLALLRLEAAQLGVRHGVISEEDLVLQRKQVQKMLQRASSAEFTTRWS